MEDSYSVENIKRLCVFMFQTCSNSQLLRRVLWISAEQTIGASLKHKKTQPLYIFNRVRVLHLNRLKERTWLHSFVSRQLCSHPRMYVPEITKVSVQWFVKVSKSRKQIILFLILPKNERKTFILKVSKSQKQVFLKLHCPKNEWNMTKFFPSFIGQNFV